MKAEGKVPKHRIGPIKGFRSVAREMMRMGNFIGRHIGVSIESEDIRRAESAPDGSLRLRFKNTGGGSSSPSAQGLDVSDAGVVKASTVGGVMPTIGGTRLDAGTAPTLSIPGTGTRYIVMNITGTLAVSSYGGASFAGAALSSITVTITVESSHAADVRDSTTGAYKVLLATFVDGVKTSQVWHGPIEIGIQDTLDGSGTGHLNLAGT